MAAFPNIETPEYPLHEEVLHAQLKTEFESGHVQSRKRNTVKKRLFKLVWNSISASDYTTLESFFDSNIGNTFTWTHPISAVVYTVRFSSDALRTVLNPGNNKRVELEIEEA